jgi:hypothetical protein
MPDNFFETAAEAKRAMKENLFTEVYLAASVLTPIQVKGWVNQANPYQKHGQRWSLYLPRIEILRRLGARNRKNLASPATVEGRPA